MGCYDDLYTLGYCCQVTWSEVLWWFVHVKALLPSGALWRFAHYRALLPSQVLWRSAHVKALLSSEVLWRFAHVRALLPSEVLWRFARVKALLPSEVFHCSQGCSHARILLVGRWLSSAPSKARGSSFRQKLKRRFMKETTTTPPRKPFRCSFQLRSIDKNICHLPLIKLFATSTDLTYYANLIINFIFLKLKFFDKVLSAKQSLLLLLFLLITVLTFC